MTELREGQAVTVPNPDGDGRIDAMYLRREEDDVYFDASWPTRDWHYVQYVGREHEGVYLLPRADILISG